MKFLHTFIFDARKPASECFKAVIDGKVVREIPVIQANETARGLNVIISNFKPSETVDCYAYFRLEDSSEVIRMSTYERKGNSFHILFPPMNKGKYKCEIVVGDKENTLSSGVWEGVCNGSIRTEFFKDGQVGESIESIVNTYDSYSKLIKEKIEELEGVADIVEKIKEETVSVLEEEKTRVKNEEQRVENENARLENDKKREKTVLEMNKNYEALVKNENVRKENEEDRNRQESSRKENEEERKENENVRIANEKTREEERKKYNGLFETLKGIKEEISKLFEGIKSSESKREENENKRVASFKDMNERLGNITAKEETRVNEEKTRLANENVRIENEEKRNQAEKIRTEAEIKRELEYEKAKSVVDTAIENNSKFSEQLVAVQELEKDITEKEVARKNRYDSFTEKMDKAEVDEDIRAKKEEDRNKKESERLANEIERNNNERDRKINEDGRVKEENKRIEAEKIREKNETKREEKYNQIEKGLNTIEKIKEETGNTVNKVNEAEQKRNESEKARERYMNDFSTKAEEMLSSENERLENEKIRVQAENDRIKEENRRKETDKQIQSTHNEVQSLKIKIEEKIANINELNKKTSSVLSEEQKRVESEEKRNLAETERVLSENTRKEKENERIANENKREGEEVKRANAETERKKNEVIRQNNEEKRIKQSEIIKQWVENPSQFKGKDVYDLWLELGNKGSKEDFINSLKGKDGINGVDGKSADMPSIRDGQWFIGEKPTGVFVTNVDMEQILKNVDEKIKHLVGIAPNTLDTFEELAKAIGNDANFAESIKSLINEKADKNHTHTDIPATSIKEDDTHKFITNEQLKRVKDAITDKSVIKEVELISDEKSNSLRFTRENGEKKEITLPKDINDDVKEQIVAIQTTLLNKFDKSESKELYKKIERTEDGNLKLTKLDGNTETIQLESKTYSYNDLTDKPDLSILASAITDKGIVKKAEITEDGKLKVTKLDGTEEDLTLPTYNDEKIKKEIKELKPLKDILQHPFFDRMFFSIPVSSIKDEDYITIFDSISSDIDFEYGYTLVDWNRFYYRSWRDVETDALEFFKIKSKKIINDIYNYRVVETPDIKDVPDYSLYNYYVIVFPLDKDKEIKQIYDNSDYIAPYYDALAFRGEQDADYIMNNQVFINKFVNKYIDNVKFSNTIDKLSDTENKIINSIIRYKNNKALFPMYEAERNPIIVHFADLLPLDLKKDGLYNLPFEFDLDKSIAYSLGYTYDDDNPSLDLRRIDQEIEKIKSSGRNIIKLEKIDTLMYKIDSRSYDISYWIKRKIEEGIINLYFPTDIPEIKGIYKYPLYLKEYESNEVASISVKNIDDIFKKPKELYRESREKWEGSFEDLQLDRTPLRIGVLTMVSKKALKKHMGCGSWKETVSIFDCRDKAFQSSEIRLVDYPSGNVCNYIEENYEALPERLLIYFDFVTYKLFSNKVEDFTVFYANIMLGKSGDDSSFEIGDDFEVVGYYNYASYYFELGLEDDLDIIFSNLEIKKKIKEIKRNDSPFISYDTMKSQGYITKPTPLIKETDTHYIFSTDILFNKKYLFLISNDSYGDTKDTEIKLSLFTDDEYIKEKQIDKIIGFDIEQLKAYIDTLNSEKPSISMSVGRDDNGRVFLSLKEVNNNILEANGYSYGIQVSIPKNEIKGEIVCVLNGNNFNEYTNPYSLNENIKKIERDVVSIEDKVNNLPQLPDFSQFTKIDEFKKVKEGLSNKIDKEELKKYQLKDDAIQKNYFDEKINSLSEKIKNKVESSTLSSYQLKEDMGSYIDTKRMTEILNGYAKSESITNLVDSNTLDQKLRNYVKTESLNTMLEDKVDKSALSNYQTKGDYALKSEIPKDKATTLSDGLMSKEDKTKLDSINLNEYQPKGEYLTPADLKEYQPKGEYLTQSDLKEYQPKGEYLTPVDLRDYQPKGEYVTNNEFATKNREISSGIETIKTEITEVKNSFLGKEETAKSTLTILNQNGQTPIKIWIGSESEKRALQSIDDDTVYIEIEGK